MFSTSNFLTLTGQRGHIFHKEQNHCVVLQYCVYGDSSLDCQAMHLTLKWLLMSLQLYNSLMNYRDSSALLSKMLLSSL